VTLSGVLTRRFEWGPPGFGENPKVDRKWQAWILDLDYIVPVSLIDAETPSELVSVRRLQSRGPLEMTRAYDGFLDRHVAITGTLWQAGEPSDVTPVTLQMTQIRLIGNAKCDGHELPSNK